MKKYAENNFASYRLEKGILHIVYKENVNLFLRGAMEVVAQRLVFQQGRAYPILCNIRGLREMGQDAQRYLAVEGAQLIKALALISRTPLAIMFTKLYIDEMPSIPMGTFTEEYLAMEFLNPFAGHTTVCQ